MGQCRRQIRAAQGLRRRLAVALTSSSSRCSRSSSRLSETTMLWGVLEGKRRLGRSRVVLETSQQLRKDLVGRRSSNSSRNSRHSSSSNSNCHLQLKGSVASLDLEQNKGLAGSKGGSEANQQPTKVLAASKHPGWEGPEDLAGSRECHLSSSNLGLRSNHRSRRSRRRSAVLAHPGLETRRREER